MNPRQQYLKQYQTGQTALTGNFPSPASNTSATGTAATQITPSSNTTNSSSLQTPAAQTYIQNQQQPSTPTPTQASQITSYGQQFTDTSGNQGTAQFNPMTGQALTPPQNSGGSNTGSSTDTNPYQDYVNSLIQARNSVAQYATPTQDELTASTNLANAKSAYTTANTQANQQNESILNAPGGTLAGAQEAAQIESRHNNANLANLADAQNADANTLSALTTNQQANLAGAQAGLATKAPLQIGNTYIDPQTGQILSNTPTQVAPGTGLFNTATGQFTPGSGASPSQILSQAQTLIANDQSTGSVHYTPSGQIDQNYYQQQASSMFGGGGTGESQNSNGNANQPQNGNSSTSGSTGGIDSIPQQLQGYVTQPTDGTAPYINSSRVSPSVLPALQQYAVKAGIPVLSADDVAGVQGIQYANTQVNSLNDVVNKVLLPGVAGRGQDIANSTINNIFQNDPQLAAFNEARSTAIKVIQGLAGGGGSGFRLTQPEVDTATDNLPSVNDNLQTAQTKLAWVKSFLSSKMNLFLQGNSTPTAGAESSSSSGNSGTSTSGFGWNG